MEVKTKRFIIKYREGIVSVAANDVAEAIERTAKELTIMPADEMHKRREELFQKE
jgi:hypothetical protein